MFTGIVEEVGTVRLLRRAGESAALEVSCAGVLDGTRVGDSISVNGVCLTVTALTPDSFRVDLMGETLDRSGLADLDVGSPVNLERALRADGRLGGHLVQGHVDAVAEVRGVQERDGWSVLTVSLPEPLRPYVVAKGSISVDGTSLTVMGVSNEAFWVGLIPHTLAATVLGRRVAGERVNLEVDVVAKYVERMLRAGVSTPYLQTEGSA